MLGFCCVADSGMLQLVVERDFPVDMCKCEVGHLYLWIMIFQLLVNRYFAAPVTYAVAHVTMSGTYASRRGSVDVIVSRCLVLCYFGDDLFMQTWVLAHEQAQADVLLLAQAQGS